MIVADRCGEIWISRRLLKRSADSPGKLLTGVAPWDRRVSIGSPRTVGLAGLKSFTSALKNLPRVCSRRLLSRFTLDHWF